MLQTLAIRNLVIIERLDLVFGAHLGVLTGETGAGKSILLDALGLACGGRADRGVVRPDSDRAQVTAVFALPESHPARTIANDAGLEDIDDTLVLRRSVQADGRSRAFVNDQPVTTTLLRSLGLALLEVHGQHDQQALADRAVQRDLLDAYGEHQPLLDAVRQAHEAVRAAADERDRLRDEVATTAREEAYLRHRLLELEALAPQPGEDEALTAKRATLLSRGKLRDGLEEALGCVRGGAIDHVIRAERALERLTGQAEGLLDDALAALDRARLELEAGEEALDGTLGAIGGDDDVGAVEARLFALKDATRKHRTTPDGLIDLLEETRRLLGGLEDATAALAAAERRTEEAQATLRRAVAALRHARQGAASRLEAAVAKELPPLKLERVRFAVEVTALDEAEWSAAGGERVGFLVATNPGRAPGPLGRIASGGELSRIMLAIKVVLARLGSVPTLVFDEIDAGIGGAVADAVGERLQRLGRERQVLVVTHAPQVAARARHHLRVQKAGGGDIVRVEVEALDGDARKEEIARMLAGAEITAAARAAAQSLLAADVGS